MIVTENLVHLNTSKHIDVKYQYLWETQEGDYLEIGYLWAESKYCRYLGKSVTYFMETLGKALAFQEEVLVGILLMTDV